MRPLHELLVIGPAESKRVIALVETARRLGMERVTARSYLDVLQSGWAPLPGTLVRLESPGGCSTTTRALLRAGIAPFAAQGGVPITAVEIDQLACDRGEVIHPRQWFLGWRTLLQNLADRWKECDLRWLSSPDAIVTAFDKVATLDRWANAGLPIPPQHPNISTYSELRRRIPDRHARVFIKLRYGYSAMGAVALEWRDQRIRAITTVESSWAQGRPRLFVTKRPRQLQREFEIAWLIDTLGMEQIVVEDWLPKARWCGLPYDLRVVMINGRMQHVVGRANASPFTNLNLDAQRISRDVVAGEIGDRWDTLNHLCELAVESLPEAGVFGLDVIVGPRCRDFTLLEANAFGDYLPGLLHNGRSTYEAELCSATAHAAAGVCA